MLAGVVIVRREDDKDGEGEGDKELDFDSTVSI